ncbi:hypothetical protein NX059_001284 [Plenodomus lindquistii]|nr:hypothetical protein NX059_001284 [Plenodomus lindquistii]
MDKFDPPTPNCQKCGKVLTSLDMIKKTGKYWKNCHICRDRTTALKRRSRESAKRHSSGDEKGGSASKKLKVAVQDGDENNGLGSGAASESVRVVTGSESSRMAREMASSDTETELKSSTGARGSIALESHPKLSRNSDSEVLKERFSSLFWRLHELRNTDPTPEPSETPKPSERECASCADSYPLQDLISLTACDHPSDICQQCLLAWLDTQMASTTWDQVRCPSSGCKNPITYEDVQKYAPADVYERFDELSMRSYLSSEPNFTYCLAPTCTSGQIHDTGTAGPIFRCAACKFRMCTAHTPPVPFHEDESCTQYTERVERKRIATEAREAALRVRREQEQASAAEVTKTSVECPGCGIMISKTVGCDHMTCRRLSCGFEFCYLCRAPYAGENGIRKAGNAAHAVTCRYHGSRLPSYVPPDVNPDEESDEEV